MFFLGKQRSWSARLLVPAPLRLWAGLSMILLCIFTSIIEMTPTFLDRAVTASDAGRCFFGLGAPEQDGHVTFRWSQAHWGIALLGFVRTAPVILTLQVSAPVLLALQRPRLR